MLQSECKNIPKSAFLSAEEQVQLLSGSCPHNILKQDLSGFLIAKEQVKTEALNPAQRKQN